MLWAGWCCQGLGHCTAHRQHPPLPPLPLAPARLLSMQSLAHDFHHTTICSSHFRPCQVPVSCLSVLWKTPQKTETPALQYFQTQN